MRILLISSTGRPYFEHCKGQIVDFLGPISTVAFVTAASLQDEHRYFEKIHERLVGGGVIEKLLHLQWDKNPREVLGCAQALFVGGGNTYALLKRLKETNLLEAIREKVLDDMPYIGSSAGSNITGPNILTSNDWNIVSLTSFDALNLVPFNINPHYEVRGTSEAVASETRDDRIAEYHAVWINPVVAIEEETVLWVEQGLARVHGSGRAKLFRRDETPLWFLSGSSFRIDAVKHQRAASSDDDSYRAAS